MFQSRFGSFFGSFFAFFNPFFISILKFFGGSFVLQTCRPKKFCVSKQQTKLAFPILAGGGCEGNCQSDCSFAR